MIKQLITYIWLVYYDKNNWLLTYGWCIMIKTIDYLRMIGVLWKKQLITYIWLVYYDKNNWLFTYGWCIMIKTIDYLHMVGVLW
jgi:hypothetical protein